MTVLINYCFLRHGIEKQQQLNVSYVYCWEVSLNLVQYVFCTSWRYPSILTCFFFSWRNMLLLYPKDFNTFNILSGTLSPASFIKYLTHKNCQKYRARKTLNNVVPVDDILLKKTVSNWHYPPCCTHLFLKKTQ